MVHFQIALSFSCTCKLRLGTQMSFYLYASEIHFHMKGCALGLALKKGLKQLENGLCTSVNTTTCHSSHKYALWTYFSYRSTKFSYVQSIRCVFNQQSFNCSQLSNQPQQQTCLEVMHLLHVTASRRIPTALHGQHATLDETRLVFDQNNISLF